MCSIERVLKKTYDVFVYREENFILLRGTQCFGKIFLFLFKGTWHTPMLRHVKSICWNKFNSNCVVDSCKGVSVSERLPNKNRMWRWQLSGIQRRVVSLKRRVMFPTSGRIQTSSHSLVLCIKYSWNNLKDDGENLRFYDEMICKKEQTQQEGHYNLISSRLPTSEILNSGL
jgi:hypothetical protein